jgi:hypothetical protein
MRLPLSALALLAISLPASAGMRAAHPQPNTEAMREHVEETGAIRPENAEAYAQQHTFDELSSDIRNWTLGVTENWTPFDIRLLLGRAPRQP